jgi:hypothetical protein
MSNFLAVATVTAALERILTPVVANDVVGAKVTIGRPQAFPGVPKPPAVNIFLYQVRPNPALRNDDLPTRRTDGSGISRPRIPLDLDYLLTFYGDGSKLEPERLLGLTARTLHAFPDLTRAEIADVLAAATAATPHHPYLATTDLGSQVELVRLTQLPLSLEDLSRLWALFPDIPYALSVAYQASVVVLQQDVTLLPVLPVQSRDIHVNPIQRPTIEAIFAATDPAAPIVAGQTLVVSGSALAGPAGAIVTLNGVPLAPLAATPSRVEVKLPAAAAGPAAGPVALQVAQEDTFGRPPTARPTASSIPVRFLLRPTLTSAALAAPAVATIGGFSATFRLNVDIPVGAAQQAILLLADPATGALLRQATAPPRSGPVTQLDFPIPVIPARSYAVSLQVDSAVSVPPPIAVHVP